MDSRLKLPLLQSVEWLSSCKYVDLGPGIAACFPLLHLASINYRYATFLAANPGPFDTPYEESSKATFVPPEDPAQEPPRELNIRAIEFVNSNGRAKRNERWHAERLEQV